MHPGAVAMEGVSEKNSEDGGGIPAAVQNP